MKQHFRAAALALAATAGLAIPTAALQAVHADPACTPVSTSKGAMTAAYVNANVAPGQVLDGDGCQIADYFDGTTSGTIAGTVTNATYFGVFNDGAEVTVAGAAVNQIGDTPFDGAQHGVDVYFADGSTGSITNSTISDYQKGGIVIKGGDTQVSAVTGNTVTGLGPVGFIAQNGIQLSDTHVGDLTGNTVTGNIYTQSADPGWVSTGVLIFGNLPDSAKNVGGVASTNAVHQNQANVTYIK